jgi:hypothetical protein
MRFYYYAIPGAGETWEIHSSLEDAHSVHESRELAILAAKARCRRHWEEKGTPCGVRIRIDEGRWEDHELFGPDAPATDPAPA